MCLPCDFHDEADSHAGVFIGAAEAVDNIKLLLGEFLDGEFLAGSPCLFAGYVVVVRIFRRRPPDSVLGILIHNDEFIFRRTACVDTCHNINSAELCELTFVKTFK